LNINGKSELNYSNLISFILKISGLELENLEEIDFDEDNCVDFNLLDEIIVSSKVRNNGFNNNKLYIIFDVVCSDIYNKCLKVFYVFLKKIRFDFILNNKIEYYY